MDEKIKDTFDQYIIPVEDFTQENQNVTLDQTIPQEPQEESSTRSINNFKEFETRFAFIDDKTGKKSFNLYHLVQAFP